MKRIKTDILIIGAGSGGLSVAAGASQMGAVFPFQYLLGFQHVGQSGMHVADFVACGLLVPAKDTFIDQCARRLGQCQRGGRQGGRTFGSVRQPEQPIGRHPKSLRAGPDHMCTGQPRAVPRQRLTDGRSIRPDLARQRTLVRARGCHGARQSAAKSVGAIPFVD